MESMLEKVVAQVPGLVVLVYLVIHFTKSINMAVTSFLDYTKDREAKTESTISRNNSVIERNTEMFGRVTEQLRRIKQAAED